MGTGSNVKTPGQSMTDVRDLTSQISELQAYQNQQEVSVQDTSPKMPKVRLWSMVNGEPLDVPFYLAQRMMNDRLPDGSPMFTGYEEQAPEYKRGDVPCFLNPNSEEWPLLAQIGIPVPQPCPAEHLASHWAKRIHAERRHRQEWATLQENIRSQETAEERAERREQIDAMLAMARRATGVEEEALPFEPEEQCKKCDYTGTPAQVTGHQASHKRRGE